MMRRRQFIALLSGAAAAWPVAAMMDGLMYDRVAGAGATLSPEAFEAGVRRSVAALVDGLRAGR